MSDSTKSNYVALDLGAGSGRAMLGTFDGKKLELHEAHRFSNNAVSLPDGLYWDALGLLENLKTGLASAAGMADGPLAGVAVDTWGVDYGLFDAAGRLLGNPRHYRDSRTDGILDKAFSLMPREQLFDATGIQFMPINTVFQLLAQKLSGDPIQSVADRLLFMPDLFNYWLTGRACAERTIASTSQCYNPRTGGWATDMLDAMGISSSLFAELIDPGTVVEKLRPEFAESAGLASIPVIAVGSHDTASAVAAVPLSGPGEAYLSSGTWSLLGVEASAPVINEASLRYNFTNEVGVANRIRLLKNITGLWILQEMRRVWEAAGESIDYIEMANLAQAAPPFTCFIDADDPLFMAPGDMPSRIATYCERSGQQAPTDRGTLIRTAYESLVFKYRWVTELLEELTEQSIHTIHIVGGGSQNKALRQWAANATGRTIKTGPVEATAAGNVLMQLMATGRLGSLEEARDVVRVSFPSETFTPEDTEAWAAAYERFKDVIKLAS